MLLKRLVVFFPVALCMRKKDICSFVTAASLKRNDMIYFPTFRIVDRLETARTMPALHPKQVLRGLRIEAAANPTSGTLRQAH